MTMLLRTSHPAGTRPRKGSKSPLMRFAVLFAFLGVVATAHATVSYTETNTTFGWLSVSSQTLIVTGTSGGTWSSGANCTTSTNGPYDGASPDDDITWQIPLGFTFNFGGTNYTQVQIMANGRLEFGSNNQCGYGGPYVQIPTTTGNTVSTVTSIIPYSMDFDPDTVDTTGGTTCTSPGCGVFYGTGTTSTGLNYFVVTWKNNPGYAAQTPTYSVQAILYSDGSFEFQYQNNTSDPPLDSNGNLPAIGWEVDTSHYFQHSYSSLSSLNNTALLYTPVPLDHFNIVVPSAGDYCTAQTILISAVDSSNNVLTSYTGSVTISSTTGNGSFTAGSPTPNGTLTGSGTAAVTYSFVVADSGSIALNFLDTIDSSVQISVYDAARGITSQSTAITYSNRNFFEVTPDTSSITPSNTVVVGKPYTFTISMHRSGNCTSVDSGYKNNQAVIMWITRAPQDPGGAAPVVRDSGGTLTALTLPNANPGSNNVTLNFSNPSNGYANVTLTTSAVGKYVLNIEDTSQGGGRCSNGNPCDGSSPTMTVRPFALVFTSIKNASNVANPGATTGAGSVFTGAGQNFSATVTGVQWQSADDANGDGLPDDYSALASTPVTSSFAWATTLDACPNGTQKGSSGPTCSFAPTGTGTVNGSVTNGSIAQSAFSGGSATASTLQYSEVGSFMLRATTSSFLGVPGVNLTGYSGAVGRFKPDHFEVSALMGTNSPSCTATFGYSGKPLKSVTVSAYNASDSITHNYISSTGFGKTVTIGDATNGTSNFTGNTFANFASGTQTLTDSVTYTFPAKETAPVTLTLRATDTDSVSSAASGTEPSVPVRSGRVRIAQANGPEFVNLSVPVYLESYQDTGGGVYGWATTTDDACTVLQASNFTLGSFTGSLNAGNTAVSGLSTLSPGIYSLTIGKPGVTGSAVLTGNVDSWLYSDWTTQGSLIKPSALVSFGIYTGNPHQIYIH